MTYFSAIFPSTGLIGFTIDDNIDSETGEVIPVITFDQFEDQFNDMMAQMQDTVSNVKKGDKGDTGTGLEIKDRVSSVSNLPSTANEGDGYLVDEELYVRVNNAWKDCGTLRGPQGIQGIQGIQGNTGTGISSTTIQYQISSSATATPTGPWSNNIVATTITNPYLWMKATLNYGDNTTKDFYLVSQKGDKGDTGLTGPVGPIGPRGPIGSGLVVKGTVTDASQLPKIGNQEGYCYFVGTDLYVWDAGAWKNCGSVSPDLSNYVTVTDLNNGLSNKVTDNKDGTEQLNGVRVQPYNKLSDTIGGRNLVKDSEQEVSGKAYDFYDYSLASPIQLTPGKTYTISCSAKVDDKAVNCKQFLFVDVYDPFWHWSTGIHAIVPISTDYQRGAYTFTIPEGQTGITNVSAYLMHPTINGKFDASADKNAVAGTGYIKELKLEQGSIATDWTPAPEDKVTDNHDNTITANNVRYDLSKTSITPIGPVSSGSFNDLPLGTVMAVATLMTDGPDRSHGFTTTTFSSGAWGGRKAQIAIADRANLMYFRVATGPSWSSWTLLSDDSKVVHSTVTTLNSTDMNTVLTAGFYNLNSGSNGMPNADAWTIYQVIPLSSLNGVQIAYQTNNAILGMRSWNAHDSGRITFTSWAQFADDSKVVHTTDTSNWQKQAMFNPGDFKIDQTSPTTDFATLLKTKYNKGCIVYIRDNEWPSDIQIINAVVICEGGGWWYAYGVTSDSGMFVHRKISPFGDSGWVINADDSKVAHLSGKNNFDTVPTVNNNQLLLASSLPPDLARTSANQEYTGKNTFDIAPIDKTTGHPYITKDGVPAVPSTLADTTKDTNFTRKLQKSGIDVATTADVSKAVDTAISSSKTSTNWASLNVDSSQIKDTDWKSPETNLQYRISNNTLYFTGLYVMLASDDSSHKSTTLFRLPTDIVSKVSFPSTNTFPIGLIETVGSTLTIFDINLNSNGEITCVDSPYDLSNQAHALMASGSINAAIPLK